jgi:6-phosphofructokinase 1
MTNKNTMTALEAEPTVDELLSFCVLFSMTSPMEDNMTFRIGVLTGGGDCPGLNPAIKAAVKRALGLGFEPIGIRDGWKGLCDAAGPRQMALSADAVRHIDREGGTILGTSRTNPFSKEGGVDALKKAMSSLNLSALIAIGGEDTLGVASKLYAEHGIPVVGIPKTIDADLLGTEYTLGCESALQVITDSIDCLRSTAESHARVFVVEVMGRHAGHLALRGGLSAGATISLIPEVPFSVAQVAAILKERKARGIRYSIVVVAEGASPEGSANVTQSGEKDAFGHVRLGGIGQWLADAIEKESRLETRHVVLSHLQRGGKPVSFDRRMGFYFGTAAVEAVASKRFGMMASFKNGRVCLAPLTEVMGGLKLVDVEKTYDREWLREKREILA